MRKTRLALVILPLFLLLMAACTPPPECPCEQIAMPFNEEGEWICMSVLEVELILGEPVPPEAYEVCEPAVVYPEEIWLADVCDTEGRTTIATDTAGAALFAGASQDGQWIPITLSGPPWVLTQGDMQSIVSVLGVASADDVWFRVNEAGSPARYGSMVADRNARMGNTCGTGQ